MNLVIDIGNTFTKLAIFNISKFKNLQKFKSTDVTGVMNYLQNVTFSNVILSSVRDIPANMNNFLSENSNKFLIFDIDAKLPVKIKYEFPHTLGKDRLALAAGAYLKYPGKNVLIIDAGTCLTTDFVNSEGEYLGGSISPGLEMRYLSLNKFTAKLPAIKLDESFSNFYGTSTESCIRAGVQSGLIAELENIIKCWNSDYKNTKIIITGGNTNYLVSKLKNLNFADENFMLYSLNKILILNV